MLAVDKVKLMYETTDRLLTSILGDAKGGVKDYVLSELRKIVEESSGPMSEERFDKLSKQPGYGEGC